MDKRLRHISDNMDAKTIFQPKIWYIICGAVALIGGIENNINAETWAESAWGEGNANEQALAMEALFGLFMCGFGQWDLPALLPWKEPLKQSSLWPMAQLSPPFS